MPSVAIVDAGPLIAAADRTDADHRQVLAVFTRVDLEFILPALTLAEAAYIVQRDAGPAAEAAFIRSLVDVPIEAPTREDLLRMADLMEQYADFPLGAADASVVALAERLGTDVLVTMDRRHFGAVRPLHCPAFHLLPE